MCKQYLCGSISEEVKTGLIRMERLLTEMVIVGYYFKNL